MTHAHTTHPARPHDARTTGLLWARATGAGLALIACAATAGLARDQPADADALARIRMQAFQASQVMDTAFELTEAHGPRLTGSDSYRAVAEWSRQRLQEWGLEARLEEWPTERPSWSLRGYSVELIAPRYLRLPAMPAAWTPGTDGAVEGVPVVVEVGEAKDLEAWHDQLRGKIVLNAFEPRGDWPETPRRFGETELAEMAGAIDPGEPRDLAQELAEWEEEIAPEREIARRFRDEGVAALLVPSSADHGVVRVTWGGGEDQPEANPPTLVVGREGFHMLVRLARRGREPRLRVDSRVESGPPAPGINVIAELPGSDPKLSDQLVMLGAHLDSWHAGTGATDNAAGCAVAMEALRVLHDAGLRPRRTIRVALWGGEEQDYGGSMFHAAEQFGDPATGKARPGAPTLSAYYNLDNGTGRVRGVYLQGNERARPVLEAFLAPFAYLGADHLTTRNTTATDHMVFDALGVPSFQFVQDGLDYDSLTHHTDQDVYDNLAPEDLRQAAAVVAAVVYQTAMRDQPMPRRTVPRRPLEQPEPVTTRE